MPPTAPPHPRSSFIVHRSAFTLTELLVVIGIIVLMLAMALPAISFITGSKSIASATNVVQSVLGRARAEALNRRAPVGVCFYIDQATDRTMAALVTYP